VWQVVSGWPTPNAGPQNDGDTTWQERREALKAKYGNGNGFGLTLGQASSLAGWPTPMAGSPETEDYNPAGNTDSSRKTVALVSGPPPSGSPALTGKRGQLSPYFSLYLMGYPPEWSLAGTRVTRKRGR
jgi:hypothetical protein